jgi:thiamine-monophosphate kinase
MSRLGALIDLQKLPISRCLAEYCDRNSKNAAELCLSGGEDYELLLTVRNDRVEAFIAGWRDRFDIPVAVIGYMTAEFRGVRLSDGDSVPLRDLAGYDHFRQRSS